MTNWVKLTKALLNGILWLKTPKWPKYFSRLVINSLWTRIKPAYNSLWNSTLNNPLSEPQLNHNSTQPNTTKVGFDMKMALHHHPPPPGTQCQHHLDCYWPNFGQNLKVGFFINSNNKNKNKINNNNNNNIN